MRAISRIMETGSFKRAIHDQSATASDNNNLPDNIVTRIRHAEDAVTWGRTNKPQWFNNIGAAFLASFGPVWMLLNWSALEHFDGSLVATVHSLFARGPLSFGRQCLPQPSHTIAVCYMA